MKGFKAFDKDLKCRGFQFKVGETFTIKDLVQLCQAGFHFCENPFDVYNYYPKESKTRICEVEALGEVKKEGDKSATNSIKIVRELTDIEKLDLWVKRSNSGNRNSGDYNSGNHNSGNYNSGNRNSGHCNSGNYNSGDYNSGNRNSGNHNSGDYNSGYYNSGYYNSGDYNSGYYNSGNHNSGYFNMTTPKVRLFNKDTELEFTDDKVRGLLYLNVLPILQWVNESSMTEEEKKNNPHYKTTKGYLKNTGRNDYSKLTKENKELILSLPGYNDKVFKEITGVSLLEDVIEITINGKVKTITKAKAKELGLIEDKE